MKKLLGALLLLSASVFARELTLQEAIDLALINSKAIKSSELSKENSSLQIKSAFKTALPSVVYNGTYQKSEYGRKIDGQENLRSGYQQTIGIYQPLFQGGTIMAGIMGAKAGKNIANYQYLSQVRDIRLETIQTFSKIVKLQKDLTVLESSKKELEVNYNKQKAQLDMRLITKADLLKTEYSILDLDSSITAAKNQIAIEKTNLKVNLMIPENEKLIVKDFEVPDNLLQGVNFEIDLTNAMSNSLSARIAKSQVEVSKAQKIAAAADFYPQVEAFAKYGGVETKKFNSSYEDADWIGGVSVSWNMFEFGKGIDDYNISKNNVKIQQLSEQTTVDNIEINVTSNYLEVVRFESLRVSTKKALEAAQENFKIDTERYNAGLISTVDYLISETQMRQAAVIYNQANIDYLVAFETYRSSLI